MPDLDDADALASAADLLTGMRREATAIGKSSPKSSQQSPEQRAVEGEELDEDFSEDDYSDEEYEAEIAASMTQQAAADLLIR